MKKSKKFAYVFAAVVIFLFSFGIFSRSASAIVQEGDLIITDFHLTDAAGVAKTTFAPGEAIYPSVTIKNNGPTTVMNIWGLFVDVWTNSPSAVAYGSVPDGERAQTGSQEFVGTSDTFSVTNHFNWSTYPAGSFNGPTSWTKATAGSYTARAFVDNYVNGYVNNGSFATNSSPRTDIGYTLEPNDGNNQVTTSYTIAAPSSTPTVNNVTISSPFVRADNVTQYIITETASDSVIASNITHEYALINYMGENAASPRGYLTWYGPSDAFAGYQDHHACSGGGWAAVQPSYGNTFIHLDACSVADSGFTRTVTFTVHFDPSFTTPVIDNDIAGYTQNIYNNFNGWTNFQTNFNLTSVLVTGATINPKPIVTDGTTPYSIAVTATSAAGGADVATQYMLINLQGVPNAGTYRGYLGWSTHGFPYFGAASAPIGCTGGGTAAKETAYGPENINLISCSTSVAGNTRTTTFVVSFNPVFTTPTTLNTLSSWAADALDGYDSWKPYDTFSVSPPMTGTLTPASGSCSILNGASSCTIPYTWTTTNPVLTSAVTSPYPVANTHVSVPDANAGTNVPFAVPFVSSPRSFYLYNNAVLLAQSTGTSSCVGGTGWNGTNCVTIVNGACSSPQLHYTCTSGTSANNVNGASYTWDCTGSGGGSTASCSEVKAAPPTSISASLNPIVAGNSTTLTWSGNGSCTGTNFSTGAAASGSITVSPISTVTYTVTCGGQSASVTVLVKKKPIFVEP